MDKAKSVAIIDYQMGNLFSVEHACVAVGVKPVITSDPETIFDCDAAILPGVGAFGEAIGNIRRLGLEPAIHRLFENGRPFLGICLGLQLLFESSEEFGNHLGLGIIKGKVRRFPARGPNDEPMRVPQIGWNQISPPLGRQEEWEASPLRGVSSGEYMYFVHSYYVEPTDSLDIHTVTRYQGLEYCSSIRRKNLFATQFHPEKSAREGLKIYRNWANSIT